MAVNAVPVNSGSSGSSGSTSTTIALGATATSGNLLICGVSTDADSQGFNTPSGWTAANRHEGVAVSNIIFYKTSDGTETGVTITWTNNVNNRSYMAEFESTDLDLSTAPLLAEDESNVTTSTSSQSTGTTASVSTSVSLGIAVHAADVASTVDGGRSRTNSYIERVFLVAGSNRAAFTLATKAISGTGTQECTYSHTDSGSGMYGQILVFLGSGDGPSGIPIFRRRIEGY